MTYFLRFEDEASAMIAFEAAGFVQRDAEDTPFIVRDTHEYSLDPIGIIYKDDEPLDGWHANYLGELPDGWEQYQVEPKMPYRKFAGMD